MSADGLTQTADLLDEAQAHGTLPFSILARHGFVAEALMRSAVVRGAIEGDRYDELKRSIDTVAGGMTEAFEQVAKGKLPKSAYLAEYGHLRPGTYDITSPRYDHREELFDDIQSATILIERKLFEWSGTERGALQELIDELGLNIDADGLLEYYRRSVVGREYGKFVFSRNISDALEKIAGWGEEYGINREDLSYLSIEDILDLHDISPKDGPAAWALSRIAANRDDWSDAAGIKLSYIITMPEDLHVVVFHRSVTNYIGSGYLEAPSVVLRANDASGIDLSGKIVCIENADPGFDWVFLKGIAGLVTKYGGMNSHMAIRCAEFGLPAAIGCGETTFLQVEKAKRLELNCQTKTLRAIQ